jgi:hypothetical protein
MTTDTLVTYSASDVGAAVKRSADWIERLVKGGKYEYLRVGRSMRFTPEQAEALIQSFTIRPGDGTELEPGEEADPLREQTSRSRNRRK